MQQLGESPSFEPAAVPAYAEFPCAVGTLLAYYLYRQCPATDERHGLVRPVGVPFLGLCFQHFCDLCIRARCGVDLSVCVFVVCFVARGACFRFLFRTRLFVEFGRAAVV